MPASGRLLFLRNRDALLAIDVRDILRALSGDDIFRTRARVGLHGTLSRAIVAARRERANADLLASRGFRLQ